MYMNLETDARIVEFANKARFPGWYIDFNGCYCCVINNMLFCVFVNSDTNELEFTIDGIGDSGYFDENYEWETLDNTFNSINTIKKYMVKYLFKK